MKVCIVGAGGGGTTAVNQMRRLDRDVQINVFSRRSQLGCPPYEIAQIDSFYSLQVQEDQIAVPLHRLIDKLESGGG